MPRILVADDNTNIQKMVSLAFEERGVDVVAVGNGEAAVRRIPDSNPDLVLADVFMPVRNGYEVCEFVKKDERFSHVPVILLVGAFDPLDEKEARRVGADGVLKKPFVPPDPLIAMVMSALEKNPKVAAELAKARETPKAPPPPPEPAMEIPAKAEPKPLPYFPEPTPEEAAAVYGFGKGVRSLDDEPEEEKQRGPKAPVSKAKDEEEDDFDGAATATDWRRTGGMDFEIPENTAVDPDPAFSFGKDLAPIKFPSEKEVPPRRVRVRDEDLEPAAPLAPLGQQLSSAPSQSAPVQQEESQSFAPYGMKLSAEPSESTDTPSAWHESAAFQSAVKNPAAPEETPEEDAPPAPRFASRKDEPVAGLPVIVPETKEFKPAPVASASSSSTPWTDLTAPPSEYPEGSWLTDAYPSSAAHDTKSDSRQAADLKAPEPPPAPSWHSEPSRVPAASSIPSSAPQESQPEAARPRKKSWFADAIEAVREVVHGGQEAGQSAPAASSAPPAEPVQSTSHVAQPEPEVRAEAETSAPEIAEPLPAPQHMAHFESASHVAPELSMEPVTPAPSRKDPALEEPVSARVTPEPLLVRDDEPPASSYEDRHEYPVPSQAFPLPGAPEVAPEPVLASVPEPVSERVPEPVAAPVPEAANGEPEETFAPAHHEEAPVFASANEPEPVEASAHTDFSERIPTMPPPNREALADIPFLVPSPAALEAVNSPKAEPPQANVDEMVQKVLERLEPQLHELLSKNLLKPLVENILQQETTKNK